MIIKSKITGRDVSTYYLGLISGLITRDEFELLTFTLKEYEKDLILPSVCRITRYNYHDNLCVRFNWFAWKLSVNYSWNYRYDIN